MKHLIAVTHDAIRAFIRLAQQDLAEADEALVHHEHDVATALRTAMSWTTQAAVLLTEATRDNRNESEHTTMKPITNVHICDGRSGNRVALACEMDGARYHVWIGIDDHAVENGILYKNPPLTVTPYDPEYFRTRRLNIGSYTSRRIVAEMLRVLKAEKLMDDFYARERAKEAADEAERLALIAAERVREAAPAMLKALTSIPACYLDDMDRHTPGASSLIRAAIAQAVQQ
jgi:hypothetical protein